ncbi:hypothetical protein E2562_020079 [Oryza meyeriana var. granulata]|uniref:Mitochondrial import inner membrane translocase subunit TIM17 n=1 Tax=Oryza meyeriana var. granulata TaxID=110450 RepID=A0A6G1ECX0_9ORYZ|nr:hypothetical protein E2562_020079 [Oryza meyeriana var. granulata]KAF0921783.1 hypothetical protein E2562_020079 [Oryza meyeriana var. granulata]
MTTAEREPCPDRILDDVGAAFAMGAVGGTAFHFLKGMYNSPNGHRLSGGSQAVRMSVARTGGSFAAWGGLFSAFDCAMVYARQKEDPWNSIIAGAATGGVLSMRHGLLATGRAALVGAGMLALIEGAGIMISRASSNLPPLGVEDPYNPSFNGLPPRAVAVEEIPAPESGPFDWLRGLFGRKEEKAAAGDRKSDMLESFETPSSRIPSFEYK